MWRGTQNAIVAAALVLLATLVPVTPGVHAAPPPLPADELNQVGAALRDMGLSYGSVVDADDVARLAGRLGVGVGSVVDPEDLERVLAALDRRAPAPAPVPASVPTEHLADLTPIFEAVGLGYGTRVDPADALVLARRLGVRVGSVVGPRDVERLLTIAAQLLSGDLPPFATVGGIELRLPSVRTELIGYHEANHDGAQQLRPVSSGVRAMTLPSRQRPTPRRSAADLVMAIDTPVLAPVTGRVVRAGTYVLYCRYSDDYAVVEPDARPGWEVKILHINGVRVRRGDRVVAGETLLASGPTPFPFRSQVDDYTPGTAKPHVHLEVVDPSIPDIRPPGGGC